MAALIGYLRGSRGEVSRLGTKDSGITSTLETWQGQIRTTVHADGSYWVTIAEKGGNSPKRVAEGNIDTDWRLGITVDDSPETIAANREALGIDPPGKVLLERYSHAR